MQPDHGSVWRYLYGLDAAELELFGNFFFRYITAPQLAQHLYS
jgi:hypothetical protein